VTYDEILSSIPPVGRAYVQKALSDPYRSGRVRSLLAAPNPHQAIIQQAIQDITEVVNPSGREIVFTDLAEFSAGKMDEAFRAVLDALPNQATPRGRMAIDILKYSDHPEESLTEFYTAIAADKFAPGLDWDPRGDGFTDLGEYQDALEGGSIGLGFSFRKILKPIQKVRKKIGKIMVKVVEALPAPMRPYMATVMANPVLLALGGTGALKAAYKGYTQVIPAIKGMISGIFGKKGGAVGAAGEAGLPGVTSILPGATNLRPSTPGYPGYPGSPGSSSSSSGGGAAGQAPQFMKSGFSIGEGETWWWIAGGLGLAALAVGFFPFGGGGRPRMSLHKAMRQSRRKRR